MLRDVAALARLRASSSAWLPPGQAVSPSCHLVAGLSLLPASFSPPVDSGSFPLPAWASVRWAAAAPRTAEPYSVACAAAPVPLHAAGGPSSVLSELLIAQSQPSLRGAGAAPCPFEVARVRAEGLSGAAGKLADQWKDGGAGMRAAGVAFSAWLAQYGEGRTARDCLPEDVIIYLEAEWPRHHRGRGGGAAAHSTLAHAKSLLSTWFREVGRLGPYLGPGSGNPCVSAAVSGYLRGYGRQRLAAGQPQEAAVPLTEAKAAQLLAYLLRTADGPQVSAVQRLALLRDRAVFSFLWATAMRAHDCGKLRLRDFRDPASPRLPYNWRDLPLPRVDVPYPAGFRLYVWEQGDKTHQLGLADPYELVSRQGDPLCAVEAVARYLAACRSAAGTVAGAAPVDYLFRPLSVDRQGFADAPLSTSTLGARLRQHLGAAGIYGGESCHSFRRGRLQHELGRGMSTARLMALGHMKSPQTLMRYLNPSAHLARLAALESSDCSGVSEGPDDSGSDVEA